MNRSVVELR